MNDMLISVIIPLFNAQQDLRQCLDSVKLCPVRDMECILVDDGSTDDTGKICREYTQSDLRFKLLTKDNSGVSDSRNLGLSHACGEYVFFLDSDDYIKPDAWPAIIDHAKEGRFDMVAFCYESLFESQNCELEKFPISAESSDLREDVIRSLVTTPMLNTCWGKLLRRRFIEANELSFQSGLRTCEDAVFVVDFIERTDSVYLVNRSAVRYRINQSGAMRRTDIFSKLKDFCLLYDRRNRFLDQNPSATLKRDAYRQYFSVVTDLLLEQAKQKNTAELKDIFMEISGVYPVSDIMINVDKEALSPAFKKFEYYLFSQKAYNLMAIYFRLKSRLKK